MEASIKDIEGKEHYVDSTALFINMKPDSNTLVNSKNDAADKLKAQQDISQWNDSPRYVSVLKEIGC